MISRLLTIEDYAKKATSWNDFVNMAYIIYVQIGPELAVELRARFEAENEIWNSPLAKALREGSNES